MDSGLLLRLSAIVGCALSGLSVPGAHAQSATAPGPEFEVASIRPSNSTDTQKSIHVTPGFQGFTAENYSLKDLIKLGWDVRSFQILGGPKWLDSDRYNVVAKPSEGSVVPGNYGLHQFQLMVRSLLADRFKLKLHGETREMKVYFLTDTRNSVSLKRTGEASGQGTSMHGGNGHLVGTQIDMPMLARNLGGELGVPVIDKTNLKGVYDIDLVWNPDEGAAASVSNPGPSIFTAVQDQLGLKLESGRGPVEILMVDYADKASAN